MRLFIYFIISAMLISLQTTVIPALPFLLSSYDMLIPFIVYFTLFRPATEGLTIIIIAGFAMDMLSGAPAGIYLFIYTWIILLFKRAKLYFHLRDPVLFQIVVVISILIENMIFGLYISFKTMSFELSFHAAQIVLIQLIWVFLTIPFIFVIFDYIFGAIDKLIAGGLRKSL